MTDPLIEQYFAQILPETLSPIQSASAYAPSNIALCKYWGKRQYSLNLPHNSSLSISLAHHGTHTQIQHSPDDQDHILLNQQEQPLNTPFSQRLLTFCNHFRRNQPLPLLIHTTNNIPTAAGLASSASGFAALTLALNHFFQLNLTSRTLSAVARIGSGSASRSLWHGFVYWFKGSHPLGNDSYATPLEYSWPDLRIALLQLDQRPKPISSRNGMNHTVDTSPYYSAWAELAEKDISALYQAINEQNFPRFGQIAEDNALAMHASMHAARPSLIYWQPQTLSQLHHIHHLRQQGLPVYATIDAGANVKILFLAQHQHAIETELNPSAIINPFSPNNPKIPLPL